MQNGDMNERRMVYVTKYWETEGIRYREVEVCSDMMVHGFNADGSNLFRQYFHRNEFWFDRQDAVDHVTKLLSRKIESVKKKLAKLEKMQPENLVTNYEA